MAPTHGKRLAYLEQRASYRLLEISDTLHIRKSACRLQQPSQACDAGIEIRTASLIARIDR
jgi:hypothetical protein